MERPMAHKLIQKLFFPKISKRSNYNLKIGGKINLFLIISTLTPWHVLAWSNIKVKSLGRFTRWPIQKLTQSPPPPTLKKWQTPSCTLPRYHYYLLMSVQRLRSHGFEFESLQKQQRNCLNIANIEYFWAKYWLIAQFYIISGFRILWS